MDRGAWRATVREVTKRQTQLSTHARIRVQICMWTWVFLYLWLEWLAPVVFNFIRSCQTAFKMVWNAIFPSVILINGERNGNPLQYSCLKIFMDRGAWWLIVHGVAKSRLLLSTQHTHAQYWLEPNSCFQAGLHAQDGVYSTLSQSLTFCG